MDRKTGRSTIKAALDALGSFQAVYASPQITFDGASPIAVVLGASMTDQRIARSVVRQHFELTVSVYTRNDGGSSDAAEDQHDDLVFATMQALTAAGFNCDPSDAAPDGAPLRIIDGIDYRTERIRCRPANQ